MSADAQTRHEVLGFTAIYCGRSGCASVGGGLDDAEVVETLRATVRQCEHGVLVAVDCLTAGACAGVGAGPGRLVLVQPCDTDRKPVGRGIVAGPLHEQADVDELCGWLRRGLRTPFPSHLLAGPAVAGPRPA